MWIIRGLLAKYGQKKIMFRRNFKRRYQFRLLLNQSRAYMQLIKTEEGEMKIRQWIDELLNIEDVDLTTASKQKLLAQMLDDSLAPALMLACAGSKFPHIARLPKKWRRFIASKGGVIHPLSKLLWQLTLLRKFKEAITTCVYLLKIENNNINQNKAVLCGLHESSYKDTLLNEKCNFFNWFKSRFIKDSYLIVGQGESADPSIQFIEYPFSSLPRHKRWNFIIGAISLFFQSAGGFIIGRVGTCYTLPDRLKALYFSLLPDDEIADMYVFTNAHYIYRPEWTYVAEKRGAKIALFFYAVNNFDLALRAGGNIGVAAGYRQMTWPIIYTQHENHKYFLERIMHVKAKVNVVGPIPYEDSSSKVNVKSAPCLFYFDVQPFRRSFMASIGRPCHIYTEEVSLRTLDDVVSVAEQCELNLYIKPKRSVGNRLSLSYKRHLEELLKKKNVFLLDGGIAVQRLCRKNDIVICQPFTSAALFAKEAGSYVAFFDPENLYEENQAACMGMPLLQGKAQFLGWIKDTMNDIKAVA
jgi:polysaccharide biosynthesis PFTS motif protein